jgi:hypothetical protein
MNSIASQPSTNFVLETNSSSSLLVTAKVWISFMIPLQDEMDIQQVRTEISTKFNFRQIL